MPGFVWIAAAAIAIGVAWNVRAQAPEPAKADGVKVYMVTLKGEFGRDLALAPMKEVLEDAKKERPDVLVVKFDCTYTPGRPGAREVDSRAWEQLELARSLDLLLTDNLKGDRTWATKPRLVFWVRKALGGAGFLAFGFPDLYYTSDAEHGGADMSMDPPPKGRSLRAGRAIGLAIKGDHPVELMYAMSRADYVLSVSYVGGKPEFHEDATGDTLLTDRRELLTLNAELALRLGMSGGTVDTNGQLFEKLGISEKKPVLVGQGEQVLKKWREGVAAATPKIAPALALLDQRYVSTGGTPEERAALRASHRRVLTEAIALLKRYADAIVPDGSLRDADQLLARIQGQLDQLETAEQADKPGRK